jgi:hypothetical protein
MKKIILYFILIIVGDFLCIKFAFVQDNSRFIALLVFLLFVYCITFKFPFKIAELLSHKKFSYTILINANKSDKSLNKPAIIWIVTFIIMLGLHICGYVYFFKYQDKLLSEKGIIQKTIVLDKKWEHHDKNSHAWYIHYKYVCNGKTYKHKSENDFFEIGDTIMIKFLPENPDNHKVINNILNEK